MATHRTELGKKEEHVAELTRLLRRAQKSQYDDDVLRTMRRVRSKIFKQRGLLSDSAELIREDRDR